MDEREQLLEELRRLAEELPLKRFFLPDGQTPDPRHAPLQFWDRLLFLLDGEKNEPMSLNGTTWKVELKPGDAWLIGKGIWEYADWSKPHRLLCIVPRAGYLRVSRHLGNPDNPPLNTLQFHTDRPVPAALRGVFAALQDPGRADGEHLPHLLRAAILIAARECRETAPLRTKRTATFDQVANYLEQHFSEPVNRENTARKFGLTPPYLSQLFRKVSGKGFSQYLLECRLDMAKHLLRNTTLPIKEIASRSGFDNEVYFTRRFRESTGRPPGQFRREPSS